MISNLSVNIIFKQTIRNSRSHDKGDLQSSALFLWLDWGKAYEVENSNNSITEANKIINDWCINNHFCKHTHMISRLEIGWTRWHVSWIETSWFLAWIWPKRRWWATESSSWTKLWILWRHSKPWWWSIDCWCAKITKTQNRFPKIVYKTANELAHNYCKLTEYNYINKHSFFTCCIILQLYTVINKGFIFFQIGGRQKRLIMIMRS